MHSRNGDMRCVGRGFPGALPPATILCPCRARKTCPSVLPSDARGRSLLFLLVKDEGCRQSLLIVQGETYN